MIKRSNDRISDINFLYSSFHIKASEKFYIISYFKFFDSDKHNSCYHVFYDGLHSETNTK